jgi:uncharacterized protein (TIGR03118 family)
MKVSVLRRVFLSGLAGACLIAFAVSNASAQYTVKNLVSNATYLGPQTMDSGLVNAWGLAALPNSPFWLSAQNSSTSRLYTGSGKIVNLVVDIPCITDMSGNTTVPCPLPAQGFVFEPLNGQFNFFGPTGIVANPSAAFALSGASGSPQPALFIWDTLDGLIVGWNPNVNLTQGIVVANRFLAGASYNGLALAGPSSDPHLYAANSVPGGEIDVFDKNFNFVGSFAADSNLPSPSAAILFVPYNVEAIGNKLYVTYFNLNGSGGILDVCNLSTSLTSPRCRRLFASNLAGDEVSPVLASPWGIVRSPHDFGPLSNKILVGNVDDGRIHAFDPDSGELVGTLNLADGTPFAVPGLWDLSFGSGADVQGPRNFLFFTAGPTSDPTNPLLLYGGGLFGVIKPAAEHERHSGEDGSEEPSPGAEK